MPSSGLWTWPNPTARYPLDEHRQDHLDLLAGPGDGGMASPVSGGSWGVAPRLTEQLSGSEIRVLRYLPTHLSAPEIAGELSVSTSTVKTHLRNLYAKLGVHSRAEAVESARTLGLLAPSARSR